VVEEPPGELHERAMVAFTKQTKDWQPKIDAKLNYVVPWQGQKSAPKTQTVYNQLVQCDYTSESEEGLVNMRIGVRQGRLAVFCNLCCTVVNTTVPVAKIKHGYEFDITDRSHLGNVKQHVVTWKHQSALLAFDKGRRDMLKSVSRYQSKGTGVATPLGGPNPGDSALSSAYATLIGMCTWREQMLANKWRIEESNRAANADLSVTLLHEEALCDVLHNMLRCWKSWIVSRL
jgi:hypothetical protein